MTDLGLSAPAVAEVVFLIAANFFINRVATFIACPPEAVFEKLSSGMIAHAYRVVGPIVRPIRAAKARRAEAAVEVQDQSWAERDFGPILETLGGLPAAAMLAEILEGCFASPVLPKRTKALIFAVVARTLDCQPCQAEVIRRLGAERMNEASVETCLTTLNLPELEPYESKILDWARGTVDFQPSQIQKRTRVLTKEIGEDKMLEAIGIAALANSVVRIAMLLALQFSFPH